MTVDLWKDLITLIAVVDPIGTIPIYLTATMGMSAAAQKKVAIRATFIAAGVLTGFIVVGQIMLDAMGISLASYQVAGGIVLFLFALQMVFDPGDKAEDADLSRGQDVAVFPVAIPSMAGPAAMMAVVILTDNSRFNVMEQATTAVEMYAVLGLTLVLMLAAAPIQRLIGDGGVNIVRRVMGLILAALAVQTVVDGIKQLVSPG
jgi:multiple antibiotic resistance protein